jgi:hypothetical protein
MGPDYTRHYTAKAAELRKTYLRVDWSDVALILELIALTLVVAVVFVFVQHGVPYLADP